MLLLKKKKENKRREKKERNMQSTSFVEMRLIRLRNLSSSSVAYNYCESVMAGNLLSSLRLVLCMSDGAKNSSM